MRINITLPPKTTYTILAILILAIIGAGAYAYNSQLSPSVFGHSVGEINWNEPINAQVKAQGFCIGKICKNDWTQVGQVFMQIKEVGGNVGIGTTTPGDKLEVVGGNMRINNDPSVIWSGLDIYLGGANRVTVYNDNNRPGSFAVDTNGAQRLLIDTSGNVGIGTTTPTEKLDVAGKIKANELCLNGVCKDSWGSVGWNPVSISLGPLQTNAGTISYNIPTDTPAPNNIPADAEEILVYVYSSSGHSTSSRIVNYELYTLNVATNTKHTAKYYVRRYPQSGSISYSSDNFWLPLTSDRKIYITLSGTFTAGTWDSGVQILGWRKGGAYGGGSGSAGVSGSSSSIPVYRCPAGKTPGVNPNGGAWASYGCQGQISSQSTCTNVEYPWSEQRQCTVLGNMLVGSGVTGSSGSSTISWSQITDKPAGFADNIDDGGEAVFERSRQRRISFTVISGVTVVCSADVDLFVRKASDGTVQSRVMSHTTAANCNSDSGWKTGSYSHIIKTVNNYNYGCTESTTDQGLVSRLTITVSAENDYIHFTSSYTDLGDVHIPTS